MTALPEHLWPQVKVKADAESPHVTLVEVRPPWDGRRRPHPVPNHPPSLHRGPGQWSICWRERNLKFHEYDRKQPSKTVQALLDYVADNGDPIFWARHFEREKIQRWMIAEH